MNVENKEKCIQNRVKLEEAEYLILYMEKIQKKSSKRI